MPRESEFNANEYLSSSFPAEPPVVQPWPLKAPAAPKKPLPVWQIAVIIVAVYAVVKYFGAF